MSSVAIKTVGCRLNQAETAQIASTFKDAGYSLLSFDDHCDVYIVHSCTITKNAERKSVQYAKSIKKKYPEALVVLAGCAVETDTENRLKGKSIDILANQKDKLRIPELLAEFRNQGTGVREQRTGTRDILTSPPSFNTTRALVKVQDGCNFCCSYCIVPQARGNPVSRPLQEVISEITQLSEDGYKEIVLTGANLGCYNFEDQSLVNLLEAIEKIDTVKRVRLSSIENSTIERDIINYMADSEKVCNYLHIPLQSGDDDILTAMGRRYTVSEYRNTIEYAAKRMDLPGLGTDIIAGFPGETEAQHKNTLNLIQSLPLNNLHVFPYSIRPGTKAASLPNQLTGDVKKERCNALIQAGNESRQTFAESYIGKDVSVLIERSDKTAKGWTSEYLEAEIKSDKLNPNDIINFKPDSASRFTLHDSRS
jgi:threonylcarbamoyladenosine tRNA methylthiotransferase MtaB